MKFLEFAFYALLTFMLYCVHTDQDPATILEAVKDASKHP